MKFSAYSVEKLVAYLAVVTGFFGVTLLQVDLGLFTLFPYRIFLLLLWLLFVVHVLTGGGKVILPQRQIRRYLGFLGFWTGYAVFSLGWAASTTAALRDVIFLFMGVSVIFFFTYYFRDAQDLRKLYLLWFSVFGCLLLLGFWEHLTGQHLPASAHYGATWTWPWIMYVPTGVFYNPNDYATFLALSIPFGTGLVRYGHKVYLRLLGLGAAIAAFYLIVTTGSRVNMLAVLLELVFLFLFLMNLKGQFKFAVIAAVCVAVLLLFLPGPVQGFFSEVTGSLGSITTQVRLGTGSVATRMNLVRNGLSFLHSTAGFGVGAGNVEYWMANFARHNTGGITNPHNWWLEISINYGILIFLGYITLYLGIIRGLWRVYRRVKNRTNKMICEGLLVALVGFFLASISSSSIMALKPQWFLFSFALAFLNYARNKEGEPT